MPQYEYKVIPAPAKGGKTKGVKTPEGRFAHTVESELNRLAQDGWEYLRSELLPSEERSGLTGSVTNWRTVLIFRKMLNTAEDAFHPRVLDAVAVAPQIIATSPDSIVADSDQKTDPELTSDATQLADPAPVPSVPVPTQEEIAATPDSSDKPEPVLSAKPLVTPLTAGLFGPDGIVSSEKHNTDSSVPTDSGDDSGDKSDADTTVSKVVLNRFRRADKDADDTNT